MGLLGNIQSGSEDLGTMLLSIQFNPCARHCAPAIACSDNQQTGSSIAPKRIALVSPSTWINTKDMPYEAAISCGVDAVCVGEAGFCVGVSIGGQGGYVRLHPLVGSVVCVVRLISTLWPSPRRSCSILPPFKEHQNSGA